MIGAIECFIAYQTVQESAHERERIVVFSWVAQVGHVSAARCYVVAMFNSHFIHPISDEVAALNRCNVDETEKNERCRVDGNGEVGIAVKHTRWSGIACVDPVAVAHGT